MRTAIRAAGMLAIVVLVACGGGRGKGGADAGKKDPGPAAVEDAGAPPAAPDSGPAGTPPKLENEAFKSKFHPAFRERDYPLKKAADIAKTPEDQELMDLLGEPLKGEKAFNRIKKAGTAKYPLLREALRCTNREVRMQSATILAILKDKSKETTTALGDAVLLDPDPDVRAQSAKAFIAVRTPDVAAILIRSLAEDPFEGARANAAWALGDIGAKVAVPALRKALSDEDTFVRLRSVSALKKMKVREAVPDLVLRLGDSSPMVRERARETLREITGVDRGEDPAKWAGVK